MHYIARATALKLTEKPSEFGAANDDEIIGYRGGNPWRSLGQSIYPDSVSLSKRRATELNAFGNAVEVADAR